MSSIAKSFTSVSSGSAIAINHNDSVGYSISGTFSGTVILEKSTNGGASWEIVLTKTTSSSGLFLVNNGSQVASLFRFRCSTYTSGTIVTLIYLKSKGEKRIVFPANTMGRVPPTGGAGWVVPGEEWYGQAKLPASQSSAELVIGLPGLVSGTVIKGFFLMGQVESSGNTVSIQSYLAKTLLTASEPDEVNSSTLILSLTADTLLSEANARIDHLDYVTDVNTFYCYVFASTAAATDIQLQSVVLIVEDGT